MELLVLNELKGFHNFHSMDRNIYRRLLQHGFDLNHSKYILAFWYFVDEKNHFKFMADKIEPIGGGAEFRELADETLACLMYLITDGNSFQPSQFKRLFEVVPNVRSVLRNKGEVKRRMDCIVKEVWDKAFVDIIQQHWLNGAQEIRNQPPFVPPSPPPEVVNKDEEKRSLFFTFSKGHPVSIEELQTLIRRWNFEDRVEKILIMTQLSARVLCKSPADVRRIVGEGHTVYSSINAKDVRVRQWLPNGKIKDRCFKDAA